MSAEAVWGIIRTILASFSGFLAAKGIVDEATYMTILGAVGTLFVAGWSVAVKLLAKKT